MKNEEPNLTTCALEDPAHLTPEQAALAADPANAAEIAATRALAARLRATLAAEPAPGLDTARRDAIFAAAKTIALPWWRATWVPAAAAASVAVIAFGWWAASRYQINRPAMTAKSETGVTIHTGNLNNENASSDTPVIVPEASREIATQAAVPQIKPSLSHPGSVTVQAGPVPRPTAPQKIIATDSNTQPKPSDKLIISPGAFPSDTKGGPQFASPQK